MMKFGEIMQGLMLAIDDDNEASKIAKSLANLASGRDNIEASSKKRKNVVLLTRKIIANRLESTEQ